MDLEQLENNMISVTVDVAGFYFEKTVTVDENASILNVMQAVKEATSGPRGASLDFSVEGTPPNDLFLDGLRITHRNGSAVSRQRPNSKSYPDGVYEFYDDDVEFVNGRLRRKHPNGQFFVNAWQYYVYDESRVDINRRAALNSPNDPTARTIVPLSRGPADGGVQLGNNFLIVWRLVAIALEPSYGDSLKVAMRSMRNSNA